MILQISITEDNVGTAISNLAAIITTIDETADQNIDNLEVVTTVFAEIATHIQNASVSQAVMEQVSSCGYAL